MESAENIRTYKCTNRAPIGTSDCEGCSECCRHMGDTIIQDPYDLWNFCSNMRLEDGSGVTFEILISEDGPWELTDHDGLLLPSIKMVYPGVCPFLNDRGRCSIHSYRSGLCRLYPLGRIYDPDDTGNYTSVSYYVLGKEVGCPKFSTAPGSKILVSDYLGIKNIDRYESFLLKWHQVKKITKTLSGSLTGEGPDMLMQLMLRIFYYRPYGQDFYSDFDERLKAWNEALQR